MVEKDGYFLWNKGDIYSFNKYFKTSEFSCQCKNKDCVEQKVSKILVDKLTELRIAVNEPLSITSGFRCKAHQESIAKSEVSTVVAKHSQHELGNAADVKSTRMPIKDVVTLAEKIFKAIGIASAFCHFDLRDDKERRWYY